MSINQLLVLPVFKIWKKLMEAGVELVSVESYVSVSHSVNWATSTDDRSRFQALYIPQFIPLPHHMYITHHPIGRYSSVKKYSERLALFIWRCCYDPYHKGIQGLKTTLCRGASGLVVSVIDWHVIVLGSTDTRVQFRVCDKVFFISLITG